MLFVLTTTMTAGGLMVNNFIEMIQGNEAPGTAAAAVARLAEPGPDVVRDAGGGPAAGAGGGPLDSPSCAEPSA